MKHHKKNYWKYNEDVGDLEYTQTKSSIESARANPDIMSEDDSIFSMMGSSRHDLYNIIKEELLKLSEREGQVINLMSCGLSLSETARFLRIRTGTAQKYLERAREKVIEGLRLKGEDYLC